MEVDDEVVGVDMEVVNSVAFKGAIVDDVMIIEMSPVCDKTGLMQM